jgi:hypothetical protein
MKRHTAPCWPGWLRSPCDPDERCRIRGSRVGRRRTRSAPPSQRSPGPRPPRRPTSGRTPHRTGPPTRARRSCGGTRRRRRPRRTPSPSGWEPREPPARPCPPPTTCHHDGRPRRETGRDAVVDDDHRATLQPDRGTVSAVAAHRVATVSEPHAAPPPGASIRPDAVARQDRRSPGPTAASGRRADAGSTGVVGPSLR